LYDKKVQLLAVLSISRLVLKIVVMARQKALMQEARVKRVWAILHFFTQFGFIVFTYLAAPTAYLLLCPVWSKNSLKDA
jgi:hypothetical protein